ncbi:ABC transporter ATP-binding protein/permease [Flavobacteriaceae bacterium]|nr:ABC transporter ATP-binding protein/permease [Flavobacteriaceae bacterium]
MNYFYKILDKKQLKKLAFLSGLLFFGMLLESLSLASVLPLISVVIDGNATFLKPYIPSEISEHIDLITIVLILVGFVFIIKSGFLILLYRFQNSLLSRIVKQISDRLYISYMQRPYPYFIDQNTSEIIKKLQLDIQNFYLFTQSVMIITIELSLSLAILISLFIIEPIGAIFCLVLFTFILLIYNKVFKKRIIKLGIERQEALTNSNQIIYDSISGIKDIIILKKASFFINKFIDTTKTKARIDTSYNNISQIPRLVIELFALGGILFLVLLKLNTQFSENSLQQILGLFAAGVFKLIPSANKILMSLQIFKFTTPSLKLIYDDLDFISEPSNNLIPEQNFKTVDVKKIFFNYKDNEVLKDLSIQFSKNEILGIYGESGTGKSTFIDILMGLQKPKSGSIFYNSKQVKDISSISAYVPQKVFFINDSILSNIAIGIPKELINVERIKEVIKICQLSSLIEELEDGLNTIIGEGGQKISGGQRQRIGIARALYQEPKLLILDESTNSLDSETESKFINDILLLKNKICLIFISHDKELLSSCNKVYKLKNGKFKLI